MTADESVESVVSGVIDALHDVINLVPDVEQARRVTIRRLLGDLRIMFFLVFHDDGQWYNEVQTEIAQ